MHLQIRHSCCLTSIGCLLVGAVVLAGGAGIASAQNGVILDQQLDANNKGYTIIRLWGSHYEMGYAQANLLGDYIAQGVNETRAYLNMFHAYEYVRGIMVYALWMPPGIEDEFDGMVDSLAISHPSENIDELDLKVACTAGEWLYGCRSHTCWGRYVAPPIRTLSTRRLDFPTLYPSSNHHVLCARAPDDGSPCWVNLGWPGIITAATGVNEFGTVVSLHDYYCNTDYATGRIPRMVACRYALTFATDPDVSTHLDTVYAELQNYEIMTGSFVNYYAPEGHGGVMVCNPYRTGSDFYYLRTPQEAWHHGEAMITTNTWTDGTETPVDEDFGADAYYDDESPKMLQSHWDLLVSGLGLQQLSVAYRARGDITIWADGRLDDGLGGRTPRLEWEWCDLFLTRGDFDHDGDVDLDDYTVFTSCLAGPNVTAPPRGCTSQQFDETDLDGDDDVDLGDFGEFQEVFAGG
ncbi:MAG: hypothetical protein KAV82_03905 [Phycisphaerae bacterium]|nr:hypothetical protein [Phycisphaerae bacterium]